MSIQYTNEAASLYESYAKKIENDNNKPLASNADRLEALANILAENRKMLEALVNEATVSSDIATTKDRKLSDLDDDRVIHIDDDLIVYKPAAGESMWAAYFIDKAKNVILGKKGTKAEVKAFADKEKMK